jgi:hypothetical protein
VRNTDRLDKNYKRCKLCGVPINVNVNVFTGYMNTSAINTYGTTTYTNTKLSLVDGYAFVDFSDLSIFSDHIGDRIVITDSNDKTISGYVKAIGTGETLGTEDITEGAFTDPISTWGRQLPWDFTGDIATGNGAIDKYIRQQNKWGLSPGTLAKITYQIVTRVSGSVRTSIVRGSNSALGTYNSTVATHSDYLVLPPVYILGYDVRITSHDVDGFDGTIDNVSMKQLLTPSVTGVTIVSGPQSTTYNWESKDPTFNYSDTAGYSYKFEPYSRVNSGCWFCANSNKDNLRNI